MLPVVVILIHFLKNSFNSIGRWFRKTLGDGKVELDDGTQFRVAVGGDKGYFNMKQIGESIAILTESAVAANAAGAPGDDAPEVANDNDDTDDSADDADPASKRRGFSRMERIKRFHETHPGGILHASFARYRSVVERVFGWLKRSSRFLAGPIRHDQEQALLDAILVLCALNNAQVSRRPTLHVTNGEGANL